VDEKRIVPRIAVCGKPECSGPASQEACCGLGGGFHLAV